VSRSQGQIWCICAILRAIRRTVAPPDRPVTAGEDRRRIAPAGAVKERAPGAEITGVAQAREDLSGGTALLVCRAGARALGVPLAAVRETMRPLPLSPFPGMPDFVLGVARIRGATVPVVDAAALTGSGPAGAERWITLAIEGPGGQRSVAVAVGSVTGIRTLTEADLQELPPLLDPDRHPLYPLVAARDEQLLLVLEASRLVPDAFGSPNPAVTSS